MRTLGIFAVAFAAITTSAFAESATVESGVKSKISSHWTYDNTCHAQRIVVKFMASPSNGVITQQSEKLVVPAESTRGGAQPCAGQTVQGVVVYYQSKAGFVGQDSFRYMRTNADNAKDPLNGEILYTITVR
jgi:hypothetical protein